MLIQALAAYADEYLSDQLAAEAWEEKPVPILLEIGPDGSFVGKIERLRPEIRGNKPLGQPLQVPRSPVNRNNGLHPLLAADDIKYVLGPGPWTATKDAQNATERYAAFAGLIQSAAAVTQDPGLEACARFYQRSDQVEAARDALKDRKGAVLVALSVDGPLVMRSAVRSFWNEHFLRAFGERMETGGTGECIISGRVGPIAPTHEKIKGTTNLKGRAEVSLMSFDKEAFCSYGWKKNANSPVAPDRAMAYVLALNDLLRSEAHRRNIAGTGFIYWTKRRVNFDPMEIAEQARPEQVAALLRFDPGADPDPNMFYMAGIAGNGGRLVVRYWLAESLGQVKANLKSWFEGLRIVDLWGQPAPAAKLWQLRFAIAREGEASAGRVLELVRRAIEGKAMPLGYDILSAILARLRHPPESKKGTGIQFDRFEPARLDCCACASTIYPKEKPI
jgi:CRISPR-associated protein Csd1